MAIFKAYFALFTILISTRASLQDVIRIHDYLYNQFTIRTFKGDLLPIVNKLENNTVTYTYHEIYELSLDNHSRVQIETKPERQPLEYEFINSTKVLMKDGRVVLQKNDTFIPITEEKDEVISFMADVPRQLIFALVRNDLGEGLIKTTMVRRLCNDGDILQTKLIGQQGDNITSFYVDRYTGDFIAGGRFNSQVSILRFRYMKDNKVIQAKSFENLLKDVLGNVINRASQDFGLNLTHQECDKPKNKDCPKIKQLVKYARSESRKVLLKHDIETSDTADCAKSAPKLPEVTEAPQSSQNTEIANAQLNILATETQKITTLINSSDVKSLFKESYEIPKEEMYAYKCGLGNNITELQSKYEEIVIRLISLYENLQITKSFIKSK